MQSEGKLPPGAPRKYPSAFAAYGIIARCAAAWGSSSAQSLGQQRRPATRPPAACAAARAPGPASAPAARRGAAAGLPTPAPASHPHAAFTPRAGRRA